MPPLDRFKRLDLRCLLADGEEPLRVVRRRLAALADDEGLMVLAPCLPSSLIERLVGEGFGSKLERGNSTDWILLLWRAGSAVR